MAVLLVVLCAGRAFADINFTDFSNISTLKRNGSASVVGSVLRLTPATGGVGSAFSLSKIALKDNNAQNVSFSTYFSFRMSNAGGITDDDGWGADGFVFVIQPNANNVGTGGGGMGYQNISHSVGVEFDTYNNGSWDSNNGNHVGIDTNGNLKSVTQSNIATRLNNGAIWYAWADYNGSTEVLEVRLAQTNTRPTAATLSCTVNLRSILGQDSAYVGFTAGTGSGYETHDILSWRFAGIYNPYGVSQKVYVNDATVREGNTAVFTIRLDSASSTATTVSWHTVNGTAVASSDYDSASGTATIPAGSISTTVKVPTRSDNTSGEGTENFTVHLSNLVNASVGDTLGTGYITDATTLPIVTVDSIGPYVEADTTVYFHVKLSHPSAVAVHIAYATSDGTATASVRYVAESGKLTIAAGSTSATIAVKLLDDKIYEPGTGYFYIKLTSLDSSLGNSIGRASMLDNEIEVVVGDADTVMEGSTANFPVVVESAAKDTVRLYWHTVSGTATAGADFQPDSGWIVLVPGVTNAVIGVKTYTDSLWEPTGSFFVRIDSLNGTLVSPKDSLAKAWIDDANKALTIKASYYLDTNGDGRVDEAVVVYNSSLISEADTSLTFTFKLDGETRTGTVKSTSGNTTVVVLDSAFSYGHTSTGAGDSVKVTTASTYKTSTGAVETSSASVSGWMADSVAPVIESATIVRTESYSGQDTLYITTSEAISLSGTSDWLQVYRRCKDGSSTCDTSAMSWVTVPADSVVKTSDGRYYILIDTAATGTIRPNLQIRFVDGVSDSLGNATDTVKTKWTATVTGVARPDFFVVSVPTVTVVPLSEANVVSPGAIGIKASNGSSGSSWWSESAGYASMNPACKDTAWCAGPTVYVNHPVQIDIYIYDLAGSFAYFSTIDITESDLESLRIDKLDRISLKLDWNFRTSDGHLVSSGVYIWRIVSITKIEGLTKPVVTNNLYKLGLKVK